MFRYRVRKKPVTCLCHKPDQSNPRLLSHFLHIHFIINLHLCLGIPCFILLLAFPTRTLYALLLSPIRATCPTHRILDLITRTIFGEQYRSRSCSLYSLLQFPVYVTGVLISPYPDLLPDVLCLMVRIFRLMLVLLYTGCHRRNGPNFGRVFLMLKYTDITQNTYIQS